MIPVSGIAEYKMQENFYFISQLLPSSDSGKLLDLFNLLFTFLSSVAEIMKFTLVFLVVALFVVIYEGDACKPKKSKGYCVHKNKCGKGKGGEDACYKWCGKYEYECYHKNCYCYYPGEYGSKDVEDAIKADLENEKTGLSDAQSFPQYIPPL